MDDFSKEKLFDQILNISLVGKETISGWQELKLLNEIKTELLEALGAFSPDLPAQFSSQIESHIVDMQVKVDMLRERSELLSFLKLYKIKVDFLVAMLDEGQQEEWDLKKEKDKFDDMWNIRHKIRNYENHFQKIYDKILSVWIDAISLERFKELMKIFIKNNSEQVDWLEKPQTPKE